MYLKLLEIRNFRGLKDLSITFSKGLNVIIAKNNCGKTAIIDALRLAFSYGNYPREIYALSSDFFIDKTNPDAKIEDISINLHFSVETEEKYGVFNDLLAADEKGNQELQIHLRYALVEHNGDIRVRPTIWGGTNEGQQVAQEILELIYHVFLGALRDAARELRPVRGSRLGQLFQDMEQDETKQASLATKAHAALSEDPDWQKLVSAGELVVNSHLSQATFASSFQQVHIDLLPLEFRDIVETLRLQLAIYSPQVQLDHSKQKYFELNQNGLGYNNLIYAATVLGNINKHKEAHPDAYTALLIEEPEAHLHPQLQNTFFDYLNRLDGKGIQIFVTSHSPTIAAKTNLDSLAILQDGNETIQALSISESELTSNDKQYLRKFLDVTKSQLFFSNGTILVEGVSEQLLLPSFARIMGSEKDLTKNGIEIVNINGVAFEHFARLFNSESASKRLQSRCAILTDDDRGATGDIASRAENAKQLEGGSLRVELATHTFEFELFTAGSNKDILMRLFQELHPKAAENISQGRSIEEYATSFVEKVTSNKAKSRLAERLAHELDTTEESAKCFTVPEYIKQSIKWVLKEI